MVPGDHRRRSYTPVIAVYESLDFVSVPASHVDAAAASCTDVLGGELRWKVRGTVTHFDGGIDD